MLLLILLAPGVATYSDVYTRTNTAITSGEMHKRSRHLSDTGAPGVFPQQCCSRLVERLPADGAAGCELLLLFTHR